MKKLFSILPIALLLIGTSLCSYAHTPEQDIDPCELAYQVAYNEAFQAEFAQCQNIIDADMVGQAAGEDARKDCENNQSSSTGTGTPGGGNSIPGLQREVDVIDY